MDFYRHCAAVVAESIHSWPVELCRMVAELAIDDVRWSDAVGNGIERSADGSECLIVYFDKYDSRVDNFGFMPYIRIVADRPLSAGRTDWTLQFHADCYYTRFGVLAADGSPLITTVRLLCSSTDTVLFYDESEQKFKSLNYAPKYVRFIVAADICTGRFSVRVRTPNQVIDDWFSATVSPVLLAGSRPVVYLRGSGSVVRLLVDGLAS